MNVKVIEGGGAVVVDGKIYETEQFASRPIALIPSKGIVVKLSKDYGPDKFSQTKNEWEFWQEIRHTQYAKWFVPLVACGTSNSYTWVIQYYVPIIGETDSTLAKHANKVIKWLYEFLPGWVPDDIDAFSGSELGARNITFAIRPFAIYDFGFFMREVY